VALVAAARPIDTRSFPPPLVLAGGGTRLSSTDAAVGTNLSAFPAASPSLTQNMKLQILKIILMEKSR
jgi:hypothetical protein